MGLYLIERYVFRKAFNALLIAVGGLIGVLWVVRAVQEVDVLLNKGQGIATYLKMTSLGVPTLAAAILPLALLIGLIRTINTLNDDSELVVLHASGASRMSLLKPFLALCLLVSVAVYTLNIWIGPSAMQNLRGYVTKVRADLVSVVVKEGRFQDIGSGLTFHIAERQPGGQLKGVLVLDGRSDKETFTYLAQQGTITKQDEDTYLVLQNGQIQRQDNTTKAISLIDFNSYAFNLSSFSSDGGAGAQSQMEISTRDLLFPDVNDPFYKYKPNRVVAELHTRLTGGLWPIVVGLVVMAYLGNPSSHRQSQTLVVTTVGLLMASLRGVTIVAEGAARNDTSFIYVMWGIPLAVIALFSFLLATDRNAFPPTLLARVELFLAKMRQRLEPILSRLRGYGRTDEEVIS